MTTPHINAPEGSIAPLVIMPGDPRRAARIAERHLTDPVLVTDVRGILGFTGTHDGARMTVIASGMGGPSMTIYATELARFYGVQRIVRVGTAGAMRPEVAVSDVVIAAGAHTDSAMTQSRVPGVAFSHIADVGLMQAALAAAGRAGTAVHAGAVFSSDHFYLDRPELTAALAAHGTLAVEMEAAALYAVAAAERFAALAVVTVSDHLLTQQAMTSLERETAYEGALALALAALLADLPPGA
ncbi:purine-nucleoside phosphorylase [Microbacterium neimengense]